MKNLDQKVLTYLLFSVIFIGCQKRKIVFEVYDNGQTRLECDVKDGIRHGECLEYYSSGKFMSRSYRENDTLTGNAIVYFEDGTLKSIIPWRKGKLQGRYMSYYPNGKLKLSSNYRNGELYGNEYEYHENGKLAKVSEWITAEGINFINTQTEFNIRGDTIFQDHFAVLKPQDDTVSLGEVYQVKIQLKAHVYDRMSVMIGNYDKYFTLQDSLSIDTLWSTNYVVEYKKKATKSGADTLRGKIQDYMEDINDVGQKNTTLQYYYFEHPYYVKDNEVGL